MKSTPLHKPSIAVIGLKGLPAFGGAATVGENIIAQLKDKYNFTVYAVASHTNQKGDINGYKQIVFRSFPIKSLNILVYYIKSMLHCTFVGSYDMIHLHHVDGAFILPILRLQYRVLSTSHARPQKHDKFPKPVKWFFAINELIMLLMASKITAVAKPLADFYSTQTSKAITFIPNGISMHLAISSSPISYNDYILFAAGRVIPSKGCHFMLEALKQMNYKGKILIIGDIHQVPKYEQTLLSYKNSLDITFLNIIKDKAILLSHVQHAKLFIYPTQYEAMSIMLLEAAYTRTPILCSDIPENTAIFAPSEVTFFHSADIPDLKQKITHALTHPTELQTKTLKAHAKLKNVYNWEKIALEYDKLYTTLTH